MEWFFNFLMVGMVVRSWCLEFRSKEELLIVYSWIKQYSILVNGSQEVFLSVIFIFWCYCVVKKQLIDGNCLG